VNEVEEIKKRMKRRKNRYHPALTDHHFLKFYNGMIKCMVVLLVGVAVCSYVKVSPNGTLIKDYIFNDLHFNEMVRWINHQLLSFQNKDSSLAVSKQVGYTHIEDNLYSNQSNEVLNFDKGRVIYVGEQDILGKYVTILLENNVEVTYGLLNDVFVGLYDQVDAATILGTYHEKVMIIFTQGEREIDYSTFEELLS
jgi:Peptidase family M23.